MEHIGIDVDKVESQICILTESGEVVERRIRTQRERRGAGREAAGEGAHRGIDRERVGGALPRGAGPLRRRGGPELRRYVRDAEPQGEDRPARRADAGRGVQAGSVSRGASDLGPTAAVVCQNWIPRLDDERAACEP
jgi:hypothetical protein